MIFSNRYISISEYDKLNEIYYVGALAGASVTDFYMVGRIIKNNEYKNNILYVGQEHMIDLNDYLQILEFDLVHELTGTDDEFRCVKDFIHFEKFFG